MPLPAPLHFGLIKTFASQGASIVVERLSVHVCVCVGVFVCVWVDVSVSSIVRAFGLVKISHMAQLNY